MHTYIHTYNGALTECSELLFSRMSALLKFVLQSLLRSYILGHLLFEPCLHTVKDGLGWHKFTIALHVLCMCVCMYVFTYVNKPKPGIPK